MAAHYVNTLQYWFDVEALMYPDIPKPGKRPTFVGRYAEVLPWMRKAAVTAAPKQGPADHKFFAFAGLVEKKVLESELTEMYRVTPEGESFSGNHVRPANGNTFLFAIEIAADGQPDLSSLQLAAFAVAFAERKNERRIGYSTMLAALKQRIHDLTSNSPSGVVDGDWLEQATGFLIGELNWQPRELLARAQLCTHKVSLLDGKGKRLPWVPEMDPINSFYLDDLERIRLDAENGPGSNQIQRYLDGHERACARLDITEFDAVNTALDARRFPAGRWPTAFPLFLMQQVAVNTSLETLASGGLFSVNGPPGTGKTTLLMDVIAARIVERATMLAQFTRPEQAFTRAPALVEYPPNAAGKAATGACFLLDERLLDCGIVVASANNKAVENITLDLPSLEKVDPQFLFSGAAPFDYFAATAQSILNQETEKRDDAVPPGADEEFAEDEHALIKAWGLVSVPLGNKKNRSRVAARLGRFGKCGLAAALDQIPAAELDWTSARTRFSAAVERVVQMQEAITQYDDLLPALAGARGALADAQTQETAANLRSRLAEITRASIDTDTQSNADALAFNLREREQHTRDWPWWRQLLARLFRPSAFAQFMTQQSELADDYDRLRAVRATLKRDAAQAITEARTASAQWHRARAALASRTEQVARLEQARLALSATLGAAAFDPVAFQQLSVDEQQKSLPRSNAAYHAARAEVFVAAMDLHKAFLKTAGKPFETNFRLALAMLTGEAYIQPHLPKMALHFWATFFLAIPVVSSTFASISRCFSDLGEGQIGLLLVDEAGQAVPSHALGAIWRSKRALIVGDPLQVEPVIKMDKQLDVRMLSYYRAPEQHLLTLYSAQHLADRGNSFGANVVQYDGSDLWVGAPLRVHRRCVDPMFSLSNDIAYNAKMVFGPPRAEEQQATIARPLLGKSCWHDLSCGDFEEHYSIAEGAAAVAMVVAYARNGWIEKAGGLPDIFLISPFKSVAQGLHSALRDCVEQWASDVDDETVTNWLKGHVGTVHTFQGKECESVVFVLGGKSPGARNWAASRPNLINVAVTRAKRRLYVIGNRREWSQTVFGKKLADAVPTAV